MERPSSYARFKYPVKFHVNSCAQRWQGLPNFDVPDCMRRSTSIAMMPVRQRPASERSSSSCSSSGGTSKGTGSKKHSKATSSGISETQPNNELWIINGDDEDFASTSQQDAELNGVFHFVEEESYRVQEPASGDEFETKGSDPEEEDANESHTIEMASNSSSRDSSDEHKSSKTASQRSTSKENAGKKNKKKKLMIELRSNCSSPSDETNVDDSNNLIIPVDD